MFKKQISIVASEPTPPGFIKMNIHDFMKSYDLSKDHYDFMVSYLQPFTFKGCGYPIIAGGFLRRWFQGEALSAMTCDVDFFFENDTQREKFIEFLNTCYGAEYSNTPMQNNSTVIEGKTFQLMNLLFNYNRYKLEIFLNKFDTFNSMILYDHARQIVVYHRDFPPLAKDKIYRFNLQARRMSPVIQLSRMRKFAYEGYKFTNESDANFLHWCSNNLELMHDTSYDHN